MKKLLIILLAVSAIDTGIFITLAKLIKSQRLLHQEILTLIESELGKLRDDASLTQREHELEKLFKCSKYPIKEKVECYVYTPTEEGKKYCGRNYGQIIVINENYKDLDGVLLHELCHAALNEHGIDSHEHNNPEWIYLINYIKDLGYTICI